MNDPGTELNAEGDAFKLHYVQAGERWVVTYDGLARALAGAFKRLEEDPATTVWISDAANQPLYAETQIRQMYMNREP